MVLKLLIWLSCISFNSLHEFHVSKTEAHYKSEKKALQLSIHVFIDDLELALSSSTDRNLNILTDIEEPEADSLISAYLSRVINFNVDEAVINPVYLGKEMSDDYLGAWCYLEYEGLESFRELKISNTLLCEVFDDQKNIISFKVDNKTKAFHILDIDETELTISLE